MGFGWDWAVGAREVGEGEDAVVRESLAVESDVFVSRNFEFLIKIFFFSSFFLRSGSCVGLLDASISSNYLPK
jgi:hypothetical protein